MKNMNTIKWLAVTGMLSFTLNLAARENVGPDLIKNNNHAKRMSMFGSTCEPASATADLDINNVRTKMLNGGDMWWDLINPKYEIPRVSDPSAIRKHSLFSGALWIGGLGRGDGLLRMAAMTYRQRGSDFWPGPLDINNASTDPLRCKTYDKIWKITRDELETAEASNWVNVPASMIDWPAGRNRPQYTVGEPLQLAPFNDKNANGLYEYATGEYPVLDDGLTSAENTAARQPDMFLWWVYNDKGNIHSETQGIPIGLELQTTAFAYATNDEVNNMTFYTTRVVNRGNEALDKTYFGQWVDADLGNYADDYVGCDVGRSLGYCYNGDDDDEGVLGYGTNPPSIGVDFFEGPKDAAFVGDPNAKELGVYAFMYYNNDNNQVNGNPESANEFYNLLQGKWLNGSAVTYGGNGIGGSSPCRYMFPDDTDPEHPVPPFAKWTEKTAGNRPGDRRFLHSSGPFTLFPGSVNKITVGVVWARTTSGGATGSLGLLKLASDKAQRLFNNKFRILDGPDAPDVDIQELEGEVVMKFLNTGSKKIEKYDETYRSETGDTLRYRFQGYMVYQLKDATISTGDLDNIEKARLLFQCDIKDGVAQIVNKVFDTKVSAYVPVSKVEGSDQGLTHSFSVKKDLFATSANQSLIDFNSYYYMVLSYAYLSNDPSRSNPEQFLAGRRNIKSYKAIPHKTEPELGGNVLGSYYGYGPKLQTIEGRGNGGNVLEFTKETIDEILKNNKAKSPVYMGGAGPVRIKVVDPIKVPKARFELVMREIGTPSKPSPIGFQDSIKSNTNWFLVNLNTLDTIFSDTTLAYRFESVQGVPSKYNANPGVTLADWGMSVEIEQVKNPGEAIDKDFTNGYVSYSVEWADLGKQWLTALADNDAGNPVFTNWIRAGKKGSLATPNYMTDDFGNGTTFLDPNDAFEKIWNGRIAPYGLTARSNYDGTTTQNTFGPASAISGILDNPLRELSSFQLVLTPDKSKWSECIVFETGDDAVKGLTDGQMAEMNLRWGTSKDKDGNEIAGSKGKSWFPGYAINLETGERMNIAFGEDSHLPSENGNDMLFNPTSAVYNDNSGYPALGGRHFIYLFGSNGYAGSPRINKFTTYDGCNDLATKLAVATAGTSPSSGVKRAALSQIMWVIPAYLSNGFKMENGIPPTEMKISVNVQKAYNVFQPEGTTAINNGRPVYRFSTEDIAPQVNLENGKKALDLANVVPNPYRAYSKYEISPIDSRVKITNLPVKCEVKIYTMSGILVRKIKKDDDRTYLDWDLKNDVNVPISSGLYLIHIDAGALGEKVIRWYGVMHTIDLDTY